MKLFIGAFMATALFFPFLEAEKEVVHSVNFPNLGIERINDESKWFITEENPFFRNITVKGKGGEYEVIGEMRPATGQFFYTVEDGHIQYIDETKGTVTSKYPQWDSFQIQISLDSDHLPKNGVLLLNLYERSEGEIIHLYPVVLEEFY